ncbi:hypothetical protein [Bradyrhizobium sp. Cp5.3]|uniref:hypothetical protein n=1 Tax=Bradyrhizobium sp. Cp5.3 TaxID=443598 RepID=UPI000400EFF7|nr:hypothetical protein [Bradyrhizobium sp. Cp5.3]
MKTNVDLSKASSHPAELAIDNLSPADVYFGRAEAILAERQLIRPNTMANRRLQCSLAQLKGPI